MELLYGEYPHVTYQLGLCFPVKTPLGKMATIVEELVSYGADLEVLDDEKAARSIVVDNMPEEAREEDIIIHFQKRKHGGGDIDNVRIIENTETVVVTFDSDEGW